MHQCSIGFHRFDRASRQVKRDPVDLVTEDYDITLRWRIRYWLISVGFTIAVKIERPIVITLYK